MKYDLAESPPMAIVKQFAAEEAALANISPALVISRDTRRAVTWARYRVMKRLNDLGYTPSGIAFTFDVDHSTVYHAVERELPAVAPRLRPKPLNYVSRAKPVPVTPPRPVNPDPRAPGTPVPSALRRWA